MVLALPDPARLVGREARPRPGPVHGRLAVPPGYRSPAARPTAAPASPRPAPDTRPLPAATGAAPPPPARTTPGTAARTWDRCRSSPRAPYPAQEAHGDA